MSRDGTAKASSPVIGASDRGSATIEFLTVTLILIIPTIYLVFTFATIESASFAAEAAAREAGRIYSSASELPQAHHRARLATDLAFGDHHLDVTPQISTACSNNPCLTAGATIHVRVSAQVPLPLIPDFIAVRVPTHFTVTADHVASVDRFVEHR